MDLKMRWNNTAHEDERAISVMLRDFFATKTSEIIVGDDANSNLPDIYSADNEIGFEVVSCENRAYYLNGDDRSLGVYNAHKNYYKEFGSMTSEEKKINDLGAKEYRKVFNNITNSDKENYGTSQNLKRVKPKYSEDRVEKVKPIPKTSLKIKRNEFNQQIIDDLPEFIKPFYFEVFKNINNKLNKLKSGKYTQNEEQPSINKNGCKHVNLIIISDLERKSHINEVTKEEKCYFDISIIKSIYDYLSSQIGAKFENAYIAHDNYFYNLNSIQENQSFALLEVYDLAKNQHMFDINSKPLHNNNVLEF